MLTAWLRRWAHVTYRHSWWVLGVWLLIVAGAGLGAARVAGVLRGGSGAIAGSRSLAVDQALYRDFSNPYTKALEITFQSTASTIADPAFAQGVAEVERRVLAVRRVRRILDWGPGGDSNLRSPNGHVVALVVGLDAQSITQEEGMVPVVRAAVAGVHVPGVKICVTGRSAITTDFNALNAADSDAAESRALPLTLVVLLLAFGSLVAAGIPLAMGVVSTTASMGILFLAGQHFELSNLAQNVSTMLGLAVGIDYSLLIISRYREAIRSAPDAPSTGATFRERIPLALDQTLATAGKAVIFSGMAVTTGLAGLLFTPLMETRSVGIGGCLVVAISVLVALSLVPALLAVLGPAIDWPPVLARSLQGQASRQRWLRWSHRVLDHPFRSLLLVLLIAGALIAPARSYVAGFPSARWLPEAMESRQGLDALGVLHLGWSVFPVYVIAKADGGDSVLSPRHLPGLLALSDALHRERLVHLVYGPVDLRPGLGAFAYRLLYLDVDRALAQYPQIAELYLSHDQRSALFEVILDNDTSVAEAKAVVNDISAMHPGYGLTLTVGGQAVYYDDYDKAMNRAFPLVAGFVIGATFLVLLLAYRSWLIPIKAVLMNLVSVGAGYGAMVAVFLLGWGRQLVGLSQPVEAIPQAVPLIIFCVVFGLSMDYEVFLLSRMKEHYDRYRDNRAAVAEGLAATGGIITSAALVMVVVFGAFARAQVWLVQMLGLGLAVAVLVDATLIRCLAVPAFMRLAGRWNWVPGDRGSAVRPEQAMEDAHVAP